MRRIGPRRIRRCSISAASATSPGGAATTSRLRHRPGNAPLNDWIRRHGRARWIATEALRGGQGGRSPPRGALAHPYLSAPYPKSLDRYDFTAEMAKGLSPEDGAATAHRVFGRRRRQGARPLARAAEAPHRLRRRAKKSGASRCRSARAPASSRFSPKRSYGAATRSRPSASPSSPCAVLRGLPISFPLTTGVKRPTTGGRLVRGA